MTHFIYNFKICYLLTIFNKTCDKTIAEFHWDQSAKIGNLCRKQGEQFVAHYSGIFLHKSAEMSPSSLGKQITDVRFHMRLHIATKFTNFYMIKPYDLNTFITFFAPPNNNCMLAFCLGYTFEPETSKSNSTEMATLVTSSS